MTDVIDMTVVQELLEICDDGDPSLVAELIGMFLDDGPAKVAAVLEGVRTGDLEQVERAAHSLKGSSGNLGAMLLMDTAEALQVASRGKDANRVRTLAPELEQRYAAAESALKSLRAQYSR